MSHRTPPGDAPGGPTGGHAAGPAAESETRLRLMLEQFPAVSWSVDRDLRFTSSAGAGLAALGLRQGEVVGRTLSEYFGTDDRTMPAIAAHHRALEGASVEYQFEWSGRVFQTRVEPFRAADGAITGAIGLAHDITETKQAFEALARTMDRYQDLVQNLDAIVYETDATGTQFTFVSRQAETLLGHPVHRWLGDPGFWPGLLHPEDRERAVQALLLSARDRHPRQFEYRARAADGRWLVLRHGVRAIGGGVPAGAATPAAPAALRGLILDVTEQKTIENEALRAQKLDSIGLLAGGIAHDFNNLLHGIFGHIALARMEGEMGDAARNHLEHAEAALGRAQELTGRLLTFARGGEPVRTVTALDALIRESVDFSLRGSKVRVEFDIAADLWRASVDAGQVSQVLGNLALNADQAMPSGGTLRVRAGNIRVEADTVPGLPPGPYVRIAFADEGLGIAAADLGRVFDPYFTTKETGTGLGLATAYSIVGRHGGRITVASEKGRGATFTIHLPAEPGPAGAAGAPPGTGAPARTSRRGTTPHAGRILLLDDEPMIRDLLGELLQSLGYDTEAAGDGREAVRLYQEASAAGRPFDLLILDLTIRGGLGGREAFEQIRALDPRVRAVVSSGYSQDPVMARWREFGFEGALGKPYTMEDLAAVLARVLGGD